MSEFKVPILMVDAVLPIEGADFIELLQIKGYQTIARKGDFVAGEPIVYIPEGSIVPNDILEEMGLVDKLAGSGHNRVKAVRLRGCLSQGLAYITTRYKIPWDFIGEDVSELLGITKWEPPVPVGMSGILVSIGNRTLKYDIEPLKMYPDAFREGHPVHITSKIHGTFCMIGWNSDLVSREDLFTDSTDRGGYFVGNKGLTAQGLVFKNTADNDNNLYVKTSRTLGLFDAVMRLVDTAWQDQFNNHNVIICGEIFGAGVQDLHYGIERGKPEFRVFDIVIDGKFVHAYDLPSMVDRVLKLTQVPVLYKGPFSRDKLLELVNRPEDISGKALHVGEGVIITSTWEEFKPEIGRLKLKEVSGNYLTRKGIVTEYN